MRIQLLILSTFFFSTYCSKKKIAGKENTLPLSQLPEEANQFFAQFRFEVPMYDVRTFFYQVKADKNSCKFNITAFVSDSEVNESNPILLSVSSPNGVNLGTLKLLASQAEPKFVSMNLEEKGIYSFEMKNPFNRPVVIDLSLELIDCHFEKNKMERADLISLRDRFQKAVLAQSVY